MKLRITPAVAAAIVAAGCANTTPPGRSELVGERYYVTNLNTYPVRIESVDGRSSTTVPQYVEPGLHRLTLQTLPGGAGYSDVIAFTLDVKPCIRYYIVAVKEDRLDASFKPKVDYELPLGSSCKPMS